MDKEKKLKEILAQYGNITAEDMTGDMRLKEDLELSSLDFMSMLGEIEDTFDVEFEEQHATKVRTVQDLLDLIEELSK